MHRSIPQAMFPQRSLSWLKSQLRADWALWRCRSPKFCDKIAGADFSGKILSQKSRAKVEVARQIFATRRGPDSGPLRTWCRFQDLRDVWRRRSGFDKRGIDRGKNANGSLQVFCRDVGWCQQFLPCAPHGLDGSCGERSKIKVRRSLVCWIGLPLYLSLFDESAHGGRRIT